MRQSRAKKVKLIATLNPREQLHERAKQASGSLGWLRPFGRVTWEKDYNNDDRTVRAGLVSTGGIGFGLPALKVDSDYVLFDLGASADLGAKLVGFVSVNATAAKSDGNYQAVTIGIRVPL